MGATLRDYRHLGLERGCTLAQLKAAFRARAKACHPDTGSAEPQEFLRLRDSYERILSVLDSGPAPRARAAGAGKKTQADRPGSQPKDGPQTGGGARKGSDDARRSYKEGVEAWGDYVALSQKRADELRELDRRRRAGSLAVVEAQRLGRILAFLERKAGSALERLRSSLELGPGADWGRDAREKLDWLEGQLAGIRKLRAGL